MIKNDMNNNTTTLDKNNIIKHFLSHLQDVILNEEISIEYLSKLTRDLYVVVDHLSDRETLIKRVKELKDLNIIDKDSTIVDECISGSSVDYDISDIQVDLSDVVE